MSLDQKPRRTAQAAGFVRNPHFLQHCVVASDEISDSFWNQASYTRTSCLFSLLGSCCGWGLANFDGQLIGVTTTGVAIKFGGLDQIKRDMHDLRAHHC